MTLDLTKKLKIKFTLTQLKEVFEKYPLVDEILMNQKQWLWYKSILGEDFGRKPQLTFRGVKIYIKIERL